MWPTTRSRLILVVRARSRVPVETAVVGQVLVAVNVVPVVVRVSVAPVHRVQARRARQIWQMRQAQARCHRVLPPVVVDVAAVRVVPVVVADVATVDLVVLVVPVVGSVAAVVAVVAPPVLSGAQVAHLAGDASPRGRSVMSTRRCTHRTSLVAFACPTVAVKPFACAREQPCLT